MNIAKILRETADKVRAGKWHGFGPSANGQDCVGLLIALNSDHSVHDHPAVRVLMQYLNLSPNSENRYPLFGWNDAPRRGADEVIDALEGAAIMWENENVTTQP